MGEKMKITTQYVIFGISLFLTFSLIFEAYSDDDHYKKRLRYRGGRQKVDYDKNHHDNTKHLKPVSNPIYKETCGECHFAYQPELLPSSSWLKILDQLDDHFGEGLDIDSETLKNISDYLVTNGAEKSSAKRSVKIMRSLGNQVLVRITDIPYIREKHHELNPEIYNLKSIGSLGNCTACHTTAEKGIYDDDDVKIPE
jgi:hypothetical protein